MSTFDDGFSPGPRSIVTWSREDDQQRRALLARLCAVHVFHPTAVPGVRARDCLRWIRRDADIIALDDEHNAYSLREDVRIEALKQHEDRQSVLAAARTMGSRIQTATQQAFEHWLENGPPARERIDTLELDPLQRVCRWLEDVPWAAREAQDMAGSIELAQHRRRLELLGGAHFVGRTDELAQLTAFATRETKERVFIVDAVGGMGKSALPARLELNVGAFAEESRLVGIHLDMDDPRLGTQEGHLLSAMLQQLAAHAPLHFRPIQQEVESYFVHRARESADRPVLESFAFDQQESFIQYMKGQTLEAIRQAHASGKIERVLIVVDTLERMVARAPRELDWTLEFLLRFVDPNDGVPGGIIVAGRKLAAVKSQLKVPAWKSAQMIFLLELDEDSAMKVLIDRGVKDPALVARLARELPRRPLTLRLAARAVGSHELDGSDDKALQRAIDKELVDGHLHLRILAHLDDPRVRAIVHPGFALRRVTPNIIRDVLGGYPRPAVTSLEDASLLFDSLKRANDLVQEGNAADELVLRPDFRRELMAWMRDDRPKDMSEVHRRAAEYFAQSNEPALRAEAVYHWLARADIAKASELFSKDLSPFLVDALAELPIESRTWLTAHLDHDIAHALEYDIIKAQIDALLAQRRLKEAADVLANLGEPPPASPLHALLARVQRLRGQVDDAARSANAALSAPLKDFELDEMRRVLVWAEGKRGNIEELVRLAETVRSTSVFPERQLTSLADLAVILAPHRGSKPRRALAAIEDEITQVFDGTSDAFLRSNQRLLVDVAAHLHHGAQLHRALTLGALAHTRDPYLDGMAMALAAKGQDVQREALMAAELAGIRWSGSGAFPWREALTNLGRSPERLVKFLMTLFERFEDDEFLVETLRALFARESRQADAESQVAARYVAIQSISKFVAEHLSKEQRATLVAYLDGVRLFGRAYSTGADFSAQQIVAAADRERSLDALLQWLLWEFPKHVRDLAGLRTSLLRRPAFQHFPEERILALHAGLLQSSFIGEQGITPLLRDIQPVFFGDISGPAPKSVQVLDILERLNEVERVGAYVPLEQFLTGALDLGPVLSEAALTEASAMLNELAERGIVVGLGRARVADADAHTKSFASSIAMLAVYEVEGGRNVRDHLGGLARSMGSGWLIGKNLLCTALHVVGGPQRDLADMLAQAQTCEVSFADERDTTPTRQVQSVEAWSDELDYVILGLDANDRPPLHLGEGPLPIEGAIVIPFFAAVHNELGSFARAEGNLTAPGKTNEISFVADFSTGSSGVLVIHAGTRVVGIVQRGDVSQHSRDGQRRGFGVSIVAILADLAARFPQVHERIFMVESAIVEAVS